MDESDSAQRQQQAHNSSQGQKIGCGESFDVLVSYDSEIQHYPTSNKSNRSAETLRELAGITRLDGVSHDYKVIPQSNISESKTLSTKDRLSALSLPDLIVHGDKNTARYRHVQVPQQDTSCPPLPNRTSYSRNTSYNLSEGDIFESLQTTTAENLLLESPSDSPAHFSRLRLTLNSLESDVDTLVSPDDSLNGSFGNRQQQRYPISRGPEKIPTVGNNLEEDLRRLVVEIYSERQTEFIPILGLGRMEASHNRDLKSQTMGDGSNSHMHYQDSASSVDAMDTKITSTDIFHTETDNDVAGKLSGLRDEQPQTSGVSFETLSSLTSTADALALQRSVIGSSPTKPASMEEIAAAIAVAEKQYRQRLQQYKQSQPSQPSSSSSLDQQQQQLVPNGNPTFNAEVLDEMPTRLAASPPSRSTSGKHDEVDLEIADPAEISRRAPAKAKSQPVTNKIQLGSLVAQNTGLAVSSAVGARFGISPSSRESSHEAPTRERVLFRSPIQAITTSRGGRTITVHKPEHTEVDSRGSGRLTARSQDSKVYASSAEVKALIASQSGDLPEKAAKMSESFVAVTAAEDQFQVKEVELEPISGLIVTRSADSSSGNLKGFDATDNPRQVGADSSSQVAKDDAKDKQSFLGAFFPWGRRQELQPQCEDANSLHMGPPVPSPSSFTGNKQQLASVSMLPVNHDSGIELAPTGSGGSEVFHAEFEPAHSSTPVKLGRGGVASLPSQLQQEKTNSMKLDSDEETDARIQMLHPRSQEQASSRPFSLSSFDTPSAHMGNNVSNHKQNDLKRKPIPPISSIYGSVQIATLTSTAAPVDQADMDSVLREKANLEGRLETLAIETEAALQQRGELQTQVATLQAQVNAQSSTTDSAQQQVSSLTNYLNDAHQHQEQLEQALSVLQRSVDMKDDNLDRIQRELQVSEAMSQRLTAKIGDSREAMSTKESIIAALKENIATLQKEAEQAHQERTHYLAELRILKEEVEALTSAKEWFQDQLKTAQNSRSKLQQDLAETQAQAKKHGTAVETLKTEKAQLQHQLAGTRQQALQEKELIAKHLETIEADFLAREAAFQDLQQEKTAVQQAVAARMDQMNEERGKLSNVIASCVELEHQLNRTEKQLADKQTGVTNLEAEKKELVKRLALVQESLLARDKELEALQEKCIDADTKIKDLVGNSEEREGILQNQRTEKASLEAALAAANQEKRGFDEALQTLRQDMSKVETSFKQMKQDLGKKDTEMEGLQREKENLQMQLNDTEEQLKYHQRSIESFHENINNKDNLVEGLVRVKDALEDEVSSLRQQLEAQRRLCHESQSANATLEDHVEQRKEELKDLEVQLESAMSENAHLEGQLEMMVDDQQRFSNLLDQNAQLKQKLAETQSSTHHELADQGAKVLRLGSDLASTQRELREQQNTYDKTVDDLMSKLKNVTEAKEKAETAMQAMRQDAETSNYEEQIHLTDQLEVTRKELQDTVRDKNVLDRQRAELNHTMEEKISDYKEKIAGLEHELQMFKELCEQQKRSEDTHRRMALDLERERGRLAGIQQSHLALKQHAKLLEMALSRRETTLAEMAAQMAANSQEHSAKENSLHAKLQDARQTVKTERETNQVLQKQIVDGKAEIARLHHDLLDQGEVLEETRAEQDQQTKEVQQLKEELAKATQLAEEQKAKTADVKGQLDEAKGQLGHLKRQLIEKHSRDPVIAERIKALEWESEQREREAAALREQLELAEHRQKMEMDNAQAIMKMRTTEQEELKMELAATRKEKFAFQGKLGQFKSALKSTLQQNKLLKAKLKSKQKEKALSSVARTPAGVVASGDVSMVPDDIIVPDIGMDVEALLTSDDKDGITGSNSKPLTALRGCLQSIKDQMGGLQEQMDEHTSAVISSSRAWKDVESKVRDLRKSCMTPPDNAASVPDTAGSSRRPGAMTSQPTGSNNNNLTPASMVFPSLPNVYDI